MHENWLNKQENILKEIDQLIKNINTKNRDLSKRNESWEYNFHLFWKIFKFSFW